MQTTTAPVFLPCPGTVLLVIPRQHFLCIDFKLWARPVHLNLLLILFWINMTGSATLIVYIRDPDLCHKKTCFLHICKTKV